jgi:uncharacterized membrane protein
MEAVAEGLAAAADGPAAEGPAEAGDQGGTRRGARFVDTGMARGRSLVMTRRKLMRIVDSARLKEAIQKAERRTSGQICVSVSSLFWGDVQRAADKAFVRLGMSQTSHRNGVLLFVAPSRRKVVVVGDIGIHEKVGQEFWSGLVNKVVERFKEDDFTEGLVRGIEEVGEQLACYFPFDAASNVNELPDDVEIR